MFPARSVSRALAAALATTTVCMTVCGPANAEPSTVADVSLAEEADPAFVYTRPAETDPERASLEEFFVLAAGFAQYALNKNANQRDWEVGTDWEGIKRKLRLGAATFDDNHFDTNWLTHPAAGFFYYTAARSNRLGIVSSFALSFLGSSIWEMFGEIRENTSWNDVIVTPTSGVPVGESMLQAGALMHRSKRTAPVVAAGWLFAPLKSLHDWLDDRTPRPADRFDDLGFADDVWHRFTVGAAGGATHQAQAQRTESDARGWLSSEVITVPGYRREGRGGRAFDSGEVTSMRIQFAGASARFVDFGVTASVLPAGWYWHDAARSASGLLYGSSFLTGLRLEVEYSRHDYDRDAPRADDRVGLVAVGATAEEIAHGGIATLRARVDVTAHFGGVMAYALDERRAVHGNDGLTSVLRDESYYHSYGATVRPALDLEIARIDAGAAVQFDAFHAIEGVGVYGFLPGEVSAADGRVRARAHVGARLLPHVRVFLQGERNDRFGTVGQQHARRSEMGLYGGAEAVF